MSRTKKHHKHKAHLAALARRRLQMSPVGGNRALFQAIAREFSETWDGTRPHGYELVYRFVDRHRGTPMPVKHGRALVPKEAKNSFLETYEWRRVRMEVLVERGARCECCGAVPQKGNDVVLNVDHIKPRRLFPHLALGKTNLQVLCGPCNHGKGNWDQTDWREDQPAKDTMHDFAPVWGAPRLVKKRLT